MRGKLSSVSSIVAQRKLARVSKKITVKLTDHFERNLEAIESFLAEAGALSVYDRLLDELLDTLIPNLERFPGMGRNFLERPAGSVEAVNALERLQEKLQGGELREYLLADYLVLYARFDTQIYLLEIKHHRQLSFDFQSWYWEIRSEHKVSPFSRGDKA